MSITYLHMGPWSSFSLLTVYNSGGARQKLIGSLGVDFVHDGAAAAAGAVFGTVNYLWRPLALVAVFFFDQYFPISQEEEKRKMRRRRRRGLALLWDPQNSTVRKAKGKEREALTPLNKKGKKPEAPAPVPLPLQAQQLPTRGGPVGNLGLSTE